jgi:hypothetical protein
LVGRTGHRQPGIIAIVTILEAITRGSALCPLAGIEGGPLVDEEVINRPRGLRRVDRAVLLVLLVHPAQVEVAVEVDEAVVGNAVAETPTDPCQVRLRRPGINTDFEGLHV